MWVLTGFSFSLRTDLENLAVIMFSNFSEIFTVSQTRNKSMTAFKAVSLKTKKQSTGKIWITPQTIPSGDYQEVFILECDMKKTVLYCMVDNVIRVRFLITFWAKEYPLKKNSQYQVWKCFQMNRLIYISKHSGTDSFHID